MISSLSNPQEIDAFRQEYLSPEVLLTKLSAGGRFLLNVPPAVGKTTALIAAINSPGFFDLFDRVAWIAGRRDLMTSTARKLDMTVSRKVYPGPTDAPCHGRDRGPRLAQLVERGLSRAAEALVCRECPFKRSCEYASRKRPESFQKAQVVFVTDQYLALRPQVLQEFGFTERSLVVLDEARGADEGFVHTFTQAGVEAELRALGQLHSQEQGPKAIAGMLDGLLADPSGARVVPVDQGTVTKAAVSMQLAGMGDPAFRFVSPLVLDYLRAPLWYEGGQFAVAKFPTLPGTVVALGGYLQPDFIRWRYGFDVEVP